MTTAPSPEHRALLAAGLVAALAFASAAAAVAAMPPDAFADAPAAVVHAVGVPA